MGSNNGQSAKNGSNARNGSNAKNNPSSMTGSQNAPKTRGSKPASRNGVEGEGSYSATRAYNQNLGRALKDKRSIDRGAERARQAVEGPEGPALRDAEKRGKSGPDKAKRAQSR
jgi:hypothetical protein